MNERKAGGQTEVCHMRKVIEIDRDSFYGMIQGIFLAVSIRAFDFDGARGTFGVVSQIDDDVVQLVVVTGSFFVSSHANTQDADLFVLELERVVTGIGFERIEFGGREGAGMVLELDLDDLTGMGGNVFDRVRFAGRNPVYFTGFECTLLDRSVVQVNLYAIQLVVVHDGRLVGLRGHKQSACLP